MKKRYKIGDEVKLSPDSEYYGGDVQGGDTIGEIVDFEYELPTNNDYIDQEEHYYKVKWGNGDVNDYRYTDLMPAEETIKKENTLKQQAVERFGFISKNDKFTIVDEDCDETIREENPENWTAFDNSLYLAKYGQGGLCICKYGKWSERASLPKNWTVKCSFHVRDQPELLEWKKSVNEVEWPIDGWIDNSGAWSDDPLKNKGIITYDQFLKWVYNPWKALQSSDEWKPKFKIGDRVQVVTESAGWGDVERGDIGVVTHIPERKDRCYMVDFDSQSCWSGIEECFILEESAPKFKIGDKVRAISQSHGWGNVEYGDIGTIIRKSANFEEEGIYFVDFGLFSEKATNWKAHESCLELVENSVKGEFVYSPIKLSSIGEMLNPNDSGYKLQLEEAPLVRVITINGISSEFKNEKSINLLIHKPKKVKRLKL